MNALKFEIGLGIAESVGGSLISTGEVDGNGRQIAENALAKLPAIVCAVVGGELVGVGGLWRICVKFVPLWRLSETNRDRLAGLKDRAKTLI